MYGTGNVASFLLLWAVLVVGLLLSLFTESGNWFTARKRRPFFAALCGFVLMGVAVPSGWWVLGCLGAALVAAVLILALAALIE